MSKLYYTCLTNVKRIKVDGLVENVETLVVEFAGVRHLEDQLRFGPVNVLPHGLDYVVRHHDSIVFRLVLPPIYEQNT